MVAVVPAMNGPSISIRWTPALHSGQLSVSSRIAKSLSGLAVLSALCLQGGNGR
jgi:hypothetical protein